MHKSILAIVLLAASAASGEESTIDDLILRLDSEDAGQRNAAQLELERRGPPAADALLKASLSAPSAEARARASMALRRIPYRKAMDGPVGRELGAWQERRRLGELGTAWNFLRDRLRVLPRSSGLFEDLVAISVVEPDSPEACAARSSLAVLTAPQLYEALRCTDYCAYWYSGPFDEERLGDLLRWGVSASPLAREEMARDSTSLEDVDDECALDVLERYCALVGLAWRLADDPARIELSTFAEAAEYWKKWWEDANPSPWARAVLGIEPLPLPPPVSDQSLEPWVKMLSSGNPWQVRCAMGILLDAPVELEDAILNRVKSIDASDEAKNFAGRLALRTLGRVMYRHGGAERDRVVTMELDGSRAQAHFEHQYLRLRHDEIGDGVNVLVDVEKNGGTETWSLSLDGAGSPRLAAGPGCSVSRSPDGKWVFVTGDRGRLLRTDRFEERSLDFGWASNVSWSPDSRAFCGSWGRGETYTYDVGTGRLTKFSGRIDGMGYRGWSPDGRLLSTLSRDAGLTLYLLDPATGSRTKAWNGTDTFEFTFMWTSDSRKVVIAHGGEMGEEPNMVSVVTHDVRTGENVTTSHEWKLPPLSSWSGMWGEEDKSVVLVHRNTGKALNCDLESGEWEAVPQPPPQFGRVAGTDWRLDDSSGTLYLENLKSAERWIISRSEDNVTDFVRLPVRR